ncbi:MAG: organomercurial lyase [Acidimicrobiia bacterium]
MTVDQDQRVRIFIFNRTADTGRVPTVSGIADPLHLSIDDVQAALSRLAAGRVLVLAPGTSNIWMANPFSEVPTPFRVLAKGRTYFGNCIWDALGVLAILEADGTVETTCGDCGEPMALEVRSGTLARPAGVVHFAVPAARWWDNIGYT